MKHVLFVAVLAVVIMVALVACSEEECQMFDGWGLDECSQFSSPLAEPKPTATPICLPEFNTDGGGFEIVWNCQ